VGHFRKQMDSVLLTTKCNNKEDALLTANY